MSDICKNHIANGEPSSTDQSPPANHQPPPNRAETNRANAQHSTGPRTEASKKRSWHNALRHGLTGHAIVLPSDDLVAYERHCKEENKKVPYNPTQDGFVFSNAEIEIYIERRDRENQAHPTDVKSWWTS